MTPTMPRRLFQGEDPQEPHTTTRRKGLLALGEGWHNNHHACQTRAPQGLAWYEIDATKYLIWGLERVGLVWNVRWHAPVRTTSTEPVLSPEMSSSHAI